MQSPDSQCQKGLQFTIKNEKWGVGERPQVQRIRTPSDELT